MEARQSARATVRLCYVVTLLVGDRLCDAVSEVESSCGSHSTTQPEEEALNKILTRHKEQPCERSWVSYNDIKALTQL